MCRGFESHPRQLIFLRKSDCLGYAVLLLVCLFDLACFFLPFFSSLIKTCTCTLMTILSSLPSASPHQFHPGAPSHLKAHQFPPTRGVLHIRQCPPDWRRPSNGGAEYSPSAAPPASPAAPQRQPDVYPRSAPHSLDQPAHFQPPSNAPRGPTEFPTETAPQPADVRPV